MGDLIVQSNTGQFPPETPRPLPIRQPEPYRPPGQLPGWLKTAIKLLGAGVVLWFLFVGCSHIRTEPTRLPFPERPQLHFRAGYEAPGDSLPELVCLSPADATKLSKYQDQLNAFKAAWERLRGKNP